jgi:hypothetical protein
LTLRTGTCLRESLPRKSRVFSLQSTPPPTHTHTHTYTDHPPHSLHPMRWVPRVFLLGTIHVSDRDTKDPAQLIVVRAQACSSVALVLGSQGAHEIQSNKRRLRSRSEVALQSVMFGQLRALYVLRPRRIVYSLSVGLSNAPMTWPTMPDEKPSTFSPTSTHSFRLVTGRQSSQNTLLPTPYFQPWDEQSFVFVQHKNGPPAPDAIWLEVKPMHEVKPQPRPIEKTIHY